MCKYMRYKEDGIPICENGQLCTLCVIGNQETYKELEKHKERNREEGAEE